MKNPMMPCDYAGVRIARSRVHGLGLFAERDWEEGQPLGVVEFVPVISTSNTQSPYVFYDSDAQAFFEMTNCFKYLNYSAKPNVAWLKNDVVVTVRGVAAGEEFVWDYGDDWPGEP